MVYLCLWWYTYAYGGTPISKATASRNTATLPSSNATLPLSKARLSILAGGENLEPKPYVYVL